MAKRIQFRRGTTAEHTVFVGAPDNTNGPISKSCCVALPFTPIVDLNVFFSGILV